MMVRAMSYVMLGIVGTMAYRRVMDNQPMLTREMRRMMKTNGRTIKKIREIF